MRRALSRIWRAWGTMAYRLAAHLSARLLALSGDLESVLLHRSAATGEVEFGRSDLDMVLVIKPEVATGARLARLLGIIRRLRLLNPIMLHREVYRDCDMQEIARHDTVWASVERRTLVCLWGRDVRPDHLPVRREDATRRLFVWWEVFFCRALGQRHRRNLEKACLECWNFFALAQGLLSEPLLRRDEMSRHWRDSGDFSAGDLGDGEIARRFLLELFSSLHRDRRPPLLRLESPFVFETVLSPHVVPHRFLVLPDPASALPAAYRPGDLVATPELLDLFTHSKNAFMHWSMPAHLTRLGITAPSAGAFRRDAIHICGPHFLTLAGFGSRVASDPAARLACVQHVYECLKDGRYPTPLRQSPAWLTDAPAYYRRRFDELERQRIALDRGLRALDIEGIEVSTAPHESASESRSGPTSESSSESSDASRADSSSS